MFSICPFVIATNFSDFSPVDSNLSSIQQKMDVAAKSMQIALFSIFSLVIDSKASLFGWLLFLSWYPWFLAVDLLIGPVGLVNLVGLVVA